MHNSMRSIPVKELPIRLGQFLKLANLVQDGFEARMKIEQGRVMVNGLPETRRGKKLFLDDTITIEGETWRVGADEER